VHLQRLAQVRALIRSQLDGGKLAWSVKDRVILQIRRGDLEVVNDVGGEQWNGEAQAGDGPSGRRRRAGVADAVLGRGIAADLEQDFFRFKERVGSVGVGRDRQGINR